MSVPVPTYMSCQAPARCTGTVQTLIKQPIHYFSLSNMSNPSLLSLPREIRSMIYAHLSDSVTFHWGWRIIPFPIGGHEAVLVRVPEAPLTNVLLACRQIYHEYSQERQFRKLVLAIHLFASAHTLPEGKATNDERVKKILQKVYKIHFVVQRTPASRPELPWKRAKGFIKKIEALAPRLELMGMVVRLQKNYPARDMRTAAVISMGAAVMSMGLEPSAFVAGLRAQVQQDYDNGASTTSAYTACHKTLDDDDMMVGEWRLRGPKDGLKDAIAVK